MKNENDLFGYWIDKLDKEATAALEKAVAEAKAWEIEQELTMEPMLETAIQGENQ